MKIEVDDDFADEIVRQWLKEMVRMSECEYKDKSDRVFWDILALHCESILNLNFKWVDDD